MKESGILVEVEKSDTPDTDEYFRSYVEEAHADQFANLSEVPIEYGQDHESVEAHLGYLLLTCGNVARVQITDFEVGEELLAGRAVISVGAREQCRNLQGGERLHRLLTLVICGVVDSEDCVVTPVRVFGVQVCCKPHQEGREDCRVDDRLADGKVDLAVCVDGRDKR